MTRVGINSERLIFIDETWAKTNMTRLRGRALRGERVLDKVPHGHWMTQIRELIESRGAYLRYLPPYSPDLNPIEMVFSKIKQLLRSLAARTQDSLWAAMQSVLDAVTPTDAANCFRHAGYSLHV